MNNKPLRSVTPDDIKKFHEDGVVLLSGTVSYTHLTLPTNREV